MPMKQLILIAIAAALLFVSRDLELQGDIAPYASDGVSTERATYHVAALISLIGGVCCFVAAAISYFRRD